ncbi:MAG: hypothetical protein WCF84_25600 [Anaerolineae bacterium]
MDILFTLLRALALFFLLVVPGYLTARVLWPGPIDPKGFQKPLGSNSAAFSAGEKILLPVVLSVLILLWLGLVLAELGIFTLGLLCALVLVYSLALGLIGRRRPFAWWSRANFKPDWIFLGILALGVLLVARPAEFFLGGSDAGVYVNMGANIARTGGIAMHDPLLQSMPADPARQFLLDLTNDFMLYKQLRLPGFFVADGAQGLVLPQFLHLYPVWLAIFDSALGPYWGLYATPLLGILSSVLAYFVARALFNRALARLFFFLLVINVPQFWFARYPVAEMLMQFLLLAGLFAFLRSRGLAMLRGEEGITGIGLPLIAGVAFADVFFTRADSVLILAPIGLYALVVLYGRLWRREHWAFFGALAVVLAQAAVHLWVFSPDYVYFQYTHFMRMKNIDKALYSVFGYVLPTAQSFMSQFSSLLPLVAAAVAGVVVLAVGDVLVQFIRRRWGARIAAGAGRSTDWARWGGVALLVALFVFGYFIWPRPTSLYAYIGGETTTSRAGNLIKFGWYLSPFGMALALLGGIVVLRRDLNRHNVLFYGASALFSVFYLEELYSNPHYIYTMRHYIPLVIPLFILLGARGLAWLWNETPRRWPAFPRAARIGAGIALALWLMYNTYAMGLIDASRANGVALRLPLIAASTRLGPLHLDPLSKSIAGTAELGGAFNQLEALSKQLDPNSVIIFANNRDEPSLIATPLHFLFGVDALVAVRNQPNGDKVSGLIDTWRAQGRPVVLAYGTNGGKLYLDRYTLEPIGHFALDLPQLAFAYQYMPRESWQINLNYTLYRPVPGPMPVAYPYRVDFAGDDYPWLVRGFLERTTGQQTRRMGALPDLESLKKPKGVAAGLRLPLSGDSATFYLALTARAPQDGMNLTLKSKTDVGQLALKREWTTFYLTLPRDSLRTEGNTLLLDLNTPAYADPTGLFLGAEFKEAQISDQPFPASAP